MLVLYTIYTEKKECKLQNISIAEIRDVSTSKKSEFQMKISVIDDDDHTIHSEYIEINEYSYGGRIKKNRKSDKLIFTFSFCINSLKTRRKFAKN